MTIEIERAVQNRVIALLRTKLGYGYWGNLKDQDNGNINAAVLEEFLANVQKGTGTGKRNMRYTSLLAL